MATSKSTKDSPAVTPAKADTKPTGKSSSNRKKRNVVFVNTTEPGMGYQIVGVSIPKKTT